LGSKWYNYLVELAGVRLWGARSGARGAKAAKQ